MHYYSIAHCTVANCPDMAGPMLLRVTWALLKLLVFCYFLILGVNFSAGFIFPSFQFY